MNVDQFVEQYEKKYQKLERIRTIVVMVMAIIVVVVIFGCGFFGLKMGWVILTLAMIAFLASILINIAQQFNANTIAEKWMNDLDMDFALEVYRKLTEKTSLYMINIMPLYFNLLCLTRNYEELEEKYNVYVKEKNKVTVAGLNILREWFLSQMKDQSLYSELIFQHKFSKYYKCDEELSGGKALLRSKDEQKMIQQLMLRQEYEKAIEEIDRMHPFNHYVQMWGEIRKQKCLYYLGRENEIYLPDAPECMLQSLNYLLNTGEEEYYEEAETWVKCIESDMPKGKKNAKKTWMLIAICMVILGVEVYFFSVDDVEKFITEERYEEKLRENGIFANDEGYTAALIHGMAMEQSPKEQYYVAVFDYSRKWLIEQEEMKLYPLGQKLELDRYYAYEDKKENYVVFLSEEERVVFYNGEQVWNDSEERILDGKNVFVNTFIIQEDFNENLIKTLSVEEVFKEEMYEIGNNHYDENDGSVYSFYDTSEGWELRVIDSASGSRWYKLDHTTDGGKTWETINEDPFAGEYGWVEGIAFYGEKVGYISISKYAGEYARVFLTEDGGYTFEEIVPPVEECEEMNPEEFQYYSMPEVNDEEIRITVRESRYHNKDGYVFRSEDRGKSWEYAGKVVDEFYYDKEERL